MINSMTDFEEFQEQLRLQHVEVKTDVRKTRVDPDGTVMEWDEQRKAWFPKIDDDFIARYQMGFGFTTVSGEPPNSNSSVTSNPISGTPDWTQFNAQLAKLREEKGEHSEEVQNLTKAAHEALSSYYSSQAYRDWYENYYKQEEEHTQEMSKTQRSVPLSVGNLTKPRYDMKPSDRVRHALAAAAGSEDAEVALARAEAEQQAGIPLATEPETSITTSDQSDISPVSRTKDESSTKPPIKRKANAPQPAWYEIDDEKNPHVYVTGLPPDITNAEFFELMSKYGVIMNEPFTNKPRVKLYLDDSGKPKGDGRCCYVKVESVELALKILDGMVYSPGYTLHVERAKFQLKGQFDPKKRRRLTTKEKKKIKEQQENLFRWSIDTSKFIRGKKERVLVIKNAFIEKDFVHDVTLIPEVRDRLRAQCSKCGVIKKIVVHDANPLGVVTVTFNTAEEADMALKFLDDALFNYPGPGGVRQLKVERWDGKTNYSVREAKDEERDRIRQWEEFLGGACSSDDAGAEIDRHLHVESDEDALPDYWETASPRSSPSCQDTDEAGGGSSGDETT